jgi:predicted nucleic acid-binding protein
MKTLHNRSIELTHSGLRSPWAAHGVTVGKTIDVIIGTFCIRHQLTLLYEDRDFDPMVKFLGLEIIDT